MTPLPAATPPDRTPADWRVLALAAAPPLGVLVLRALLQDTTESDTLQRLATAQLVSDPAQAFWLAAQPLGVAVLVLGAVAGGFVVALRRRGWARLRPWVLALWVLMWAAMGAWLVVSELNRAGRQPLPAQPARVLLAREVLPGKRTGAGGTEVYFELAGNATPRRLFVEGVPVQAFAPGSTARLHAEAGRWWGTWGRLEPRLDRSTPPLDAPAGGSPGG